MLTFHQVKLLTVRMKFLETETEKALNTAALATQQAQNATVLWRNLSATRDSPPILSATARSSNSSNSSYGSGQNEKGGMLFNISIDTNGEDEEINGEVEEDYGL